MDDASLGQFGCGKHNPYCPVMDSGRADRILLFFGVDEGSTVVGLARQFQPTCFVPASLCGCYGTLEMLLAEEREKGLDCEEVGDGGTFLIGELFEAI
jgi:hypothetical protein